ncbi:PREDICTED: coiled-coil domain-containing protein R3HCC1L-like [Amphimedon queenslandica]|uniref:R3H domain-containing protein n=1 Tax=Amphimedon queenslandica TaxID=400682 RepID=A0A1X7VPH8_AMPQE|nr:PREDICTED: coiled-coil domain-containing protein R3HCC1L-like [Amphimedon queenslandica]|eukprot:XP_019859318.1 PREDICTED: coiled-coil domain-containing protein R3HCC1L-like [Amphimedon queenslandica]
MASVEESEETPGESLTDSLANLKLEDSPERVVTLDGDTAQKVSLLDKYYGPLPEAEDKTEEFDYVIEVHGFSPNLKTKDILNELFINKSSEFMKLKWVDDTHALAIYTSSSDASFIAESSFKNIQTRLLSDSNHEASIFIAKSYAKSIRDFLCSKKPSHSSTELESNSSIPEKPPLSASVARRMIGHALGVRITASPEQKEKENRLWKEAKEKKKQRKTD